MEDAKTLPTAYLLGSGYEKKEAALLSSKLAWKNEYFEGTLGHPWEKVVAWHWKMYNACAICVYKCYALLQVNFQSVVEERFHVFDEWRAGSLHRWLRVLHPSQI